MMKKHLIGDVFHKTKINPKTYFELVAATDRLEPVHYCRAFLLR